MHPSSTTRIRRTEVRRAGIGLMVLGSILLAAKARATTTPSNPAIYAAGIDPTGCSSDTTLCLSEGRFLVDATWTRPDGSSGIAHAVPLTPVSGYFWFFEPGNVELAVKALNGCSANGHYWFFSGGLTNLAVTITVTDLATNEVKVYTNPPGRAFQPITDTSAFSSCPAGAAALGNPEEPPGDFLAAPLTRVRKDPAAGCAGDDTILCLDGRFRIEASWQAASGRSGVAHAAPLTARSGYFWFFDPSNVELIVKTLDACGIGRGRWFFAAGMTTAGVELKVTDTFTGETRNYTRPAGVSFAPVQDTGAFSFCPTPTPTFTPTPTPTSTPASTPAAARTRTPTRTPRPTTTRTPEPTGTPTPMHTALPTPAVTPTPTTWLIELTGYCNSSGSIHVRAGDTVTWHWSSGNHRIVSGWDLRKCGCEILGHCSLCYRGCVGDGLWDSGLQPGPYSFSRTFPEAGFFPYFEETFHSLGYYHVGTHAITVDP
jgi:cell division septation protein DedD